MFLTGCVSEGGSSLKRNMGYGPNIHMSNMHGTDDGSFKYQNLFIAQTVPDNPSSEGMGGGSDYSPPDPGDSLPSGRDEPPGFPGR